MTDRVVYFNGEFVNEMDAKVSIYDSALMFGDTVFEMTRSFNKKQFKLEDHIDRLMQGIKIYRIPFKFSKMQLIDICHQTVKRNEDLFDDADEHRLMINVSRGPLSIYSHLFNKPGPTLIVADFPLKWTVNSMGKLYDEGINAVITNQKAIPSYLMDPKIKNRSRVFYQMANIEASMFKGQNNWALLQDINGFIAEGAGDNFFIIKNEIIYTPKTTHCLDGISRRYIFEIAKELNLKCIEKDIEFYDVCDADEAFMTGTPFCILPVGSINGIKIGEKIYGDITKKLLNKWSKNVNVNIEEQLKSYYIKDKKTNGPSPYQFK
ncbi:aminotransferase class IV [bacterium]|nr:aminotransferase class IV [bacterium]